MTNTETLSRVVADAMTQAGVTPDAAAVRLDVHPSTVTRRLEQSNLSAGDLHEIAKLARTCASDLMARAEEQP